MKGTILVVALCSIYGVTALSEADVAELMKYQDACIAESGVDPVLIENAKKGDVAPDENLACFASCMLQKLGMMNDQGVLNLDNIRAKIPDNVDKAKAEEVINKCKDVPGNHHCLKAGNFVQCFMQHKEFAVLQ
uniref:Putative odorant-binding protein 1 n=1 Tax=Sclerodermus sichuanensis TaxID=592144 RepID=A0A0R7J2A9_9HYME|nr:putative odorant-binding protein 1 [Sclerodermus sichuanensis]